MDNVRACLKKSSIEVRVQVHQPVFSQIGVTQRRSPQLHLLLKSVTFIIVGLDDRTRA
jgi:hypothetical protein